MLLHAESILVNLPSGSPKAALLTTGMKWAASSGYTVNVRVPQTSATCVFQPLMAIRNRSGIGEEHTMVSARACCILFDSP
jgi:hypothetical protein